MRRLLLAALVALTLPATANAATIPVAPGGSLTAAYNAAVPGDVIELYTGLYGVWTTPSGSKTVTVRAAAGAKPVLRQLDSNANNITFDGLSIDANNAKPPNPNMALFETGGQSNITFRNGSIGNVVDQKGALLGGNVDPAPLGIVIDNVRFWNVRPVGSDVHNECIYLMAPGTVIKNSTFEGTCGNTGAILTQRGSWWGQQPWNGITFTGNTFARQLYDHGSILFGNHCGDIGAVCSDIVIRGNTFDSHSMPQNATPGLTYTNSVESCNTPTVDTLPGFTHEACGPVPSPTPSPIPTATPSPEPTPTVTPEPTPAPYAPACAPTCDEQITALTAERDKAQAALDRARQAWRDLADVLG